MTIFIPTDDVEKVYILRDRIRWNMWQKGKFPPPIHYSYGFRHGTSGFHLCWEEEE